MWPYQVLAGVASPKQYVFFVGCAGVVTTTTGAVAPASYFVPHHHRVFPSSFVVLRREKRAHFVPLCSTTTGVAAFTPATLPSVVRALWCLDSTGKPTSAAVYGATGAPLGDTVAESLVTPKVERGASDAPPVSDSEDHA